LANLKYNTNSPLQLRAQPLGTLTRKWGDGTGCPEEKISTDGETFRDSNNGKDMSDILPTQGPPGTEVELSLGTG
jgi:hypothetical protein